MKISVIVPAYNAEAHLRETLDCLANQSLKDFQIVAVDDGSTDSTGAIIDEYAEKDSRFLPVRQKNAGVSAARNNGLKRAGGKYVLFLDADDLLTSDALENIYGALEATGADVAIFRVMRFGYGGEKYNPLVDALTKLETIDDFDKRLLWNFLVGNKCYRRDSLLKSGNLFPPLKYSEDGVFFMRFLYDFRPKITGVFDAVMLYRRHTADERPSVTQKVTRELLEDFSRAYSSIYEAAARTLGEDSGDYLQEILYKNFFALYTEFYRCLWRGNDDALALMGEETEKLRAKMTEKTLKKCEICIRDVGEPVFSKAGIAERPIVSVIAKNCSPEFEASLYSQTTPVFELIVPDSTGATRRENVVALPQKGFRFAAKKAARGETVIFIGGQKALDPRFLKMVSLLKKSRRFGVFPDFCIKLGALILVEFKKIRKVPL